MSIVERSYPARVDVIERLMKQKGLSLKKLAEGAATSDRTLKRILKEGARAHLATYRKLAGPEALDVEDVSTLYIDDAKRSTTATDEIEQPQAKVERRPAQSKATIGRPVRPKAKFDHRYTEVEVKLEEDPKTFDETDQLAQILEAIKTAAGTKHPIKIITVILNSVTLRLGLHPDDVPLLLKAFSEGRLQRLRLIAVTIRAPVIAERVTRAILTIKTPEPDSALELTTNTDGSITLHRAFS